MTTPNIKKSCPRRPHDRGLGVARFGRLAARQPPVYIRNQERNAHDSPFIAVRSGSAGCVAGGAVPTSPVANLASGAPQKKEPTVKVIEAGLVGSLDYKIIEATRADDLFQWLKDNKYHYEGDEASLNFYVQKKWLFTVMKIDTMQMKRNKDGSFAGEVTPTRFQFASEKLVYPLKITQISVKDKTEALFYVQAPTKIDLPGDMTYQYTWVPMLQAASGCTPGGLPCRGGDLLKAIDGKSHGLLNKGRELGFNFQPVHR